MKQYTYEQIIKVMQNKYYKVFLYDKKPFNLNIVSIRSEDKTPNVFNDILSVFWCYQSKWYQKNYKITTDPGLYWLLNPMNVNGTAIVKPGRYEGLWKIGLHQGKYEALVQVGNITLIRDYDRDNELDYNSDREETVNNAGINLHHAGENSQLVDKWSAGCQVFQNIKDFNEFMTIAKLSVEEFGDSFTYILLEEKDFKDVI